MVQGRAINSSGIAGIASHLDAILLIINDDGLPGFENKKANTPETRINNHTVTLISINTDSDERVPKNDLILSNMEVC